MEDTDKATPRPWRRNDSRWAVCADGVTIVEVHPSMRDRPDPEGGPVGYVMAKVNFETIDGKATETCKARARGIVAAINAYDAHRALVEAARRLLDRFTDILVFEREEDPDADPEVVAMNAALAAVEAAEGK